MEGMDTILSPTKWRSAERAGTLCTNAFEFTVECDNMWDFPNADCRSFTAATQELLKSRMCAVCAGVAATYGGEIDVKYRCKWSQHIVFTLYRYIIVDFVVITHVDGYPSTINAYPECVRIVQTAAAKVVGEANSKHPQKTMGAEDFSYFLQERPGTD
jgi:metal-dependent amidase/aminoacylase/carboxypeptidase family protein